MIKFIKIGFGTPLNEKILLFWEKSEHIEDGVLFIMKRGELSHRLFDGEQLNDQPSHWMHIPGILK